MEFFEDGRLELYNLKDDLGEKTNLAAKMPEKAKELHGKLVAWREAGRGEDADDEQEVTHACRKAGQPEHAR